MADPGQEFQLTDVILKPGLPRRRLLFGGVNDQKCFIHYETGGIGHFYSLVVFKMGSPALTCTWAVYTDEGATDLPGLRTLVARRRFTPMFPAYR